MKASSFPTSSQVADRTHESTPVLKPSLELYCRGKVSTYGRGQEICGLGNPADRWSCISSGVARRYVVRPDGRRQIIELLLPGDYFGFTTNDSWEFGVEAVNDNVVVVSYPRRRLELLADSDPRLARELREAAFQALSHLQCQLLIVGRVTALEKVCSFILEIAHRRPNGRGNYVSLPISRYDIADYLAVSTETVSRALTELQLRGIIKMPHIRTVEIVNEEALEDADALDLTAARAPMSHSARPAIPRLASNYSL
ncbi:MAG: helix-turn-helix domain-containing protein [Burkholderiales bacterium]